MSMRAGSAGRHTYALRFVGEQADELLAIRAPVSLRASDRLRLHAEIAQAVLGLRHQRSARQRRR